jgi:hypothetical protein
VSSDDDAGRDDKPPSFHREPRGRPPRPSRSGEGMDSVLLHLRDQLRRNVVERLPEDDPEASA